MGGGKGHREVPGFVRNRGRHVVRLKRSSDGTPPEGVYKCVVRDTTDINQTVYVVIYSLINGICNTCLVCSIVFLCNLISVPSSSVFISSSVVTGNSVTFNSFIFVTISAVNLLQNLMQPLLRELSSVIQLVPRILAALLLK